MRKRRQNKRRRSFAMRHTSNLETWCSDKPVGFRIIAKILALSPDDTAWGLNFRRDGEFPSEWVVPGTPIWHKMYYRTGRAQRRG